MTESGTPTWDFVREHVRRFADLGADWDSYGADPPSPAQIDAAVSLCAALERSEWVPPNDAYPLPDGNVVLAWHKGDKHYLVEVEGDGVGSLMVSAPEGAVFHRASWSANRVAFAPPLVFS